MTADLVLKNANVITVDPTRPRAGLVAVRADRIIHVGDGGDLDALSRPGTRVIDCQGQTVVPGFNDAHCHFFSFIRKSLALDLSPASVHSIADIKEVIRRRAQSTPPGTWISGTDYNEFYLAEKRHPARRDLDEVALHHPVVLSHRSLHACVLNSAALSLARITRETPDPPGSLVERDPATGEPTGLLWELLGYIREQVMPQITQEDLDRGVTVANRSYLSYGITSLQDATVINGSLQWERQRRFKANGSLKTRVYMMIGFEAMDKFREAGLKTGSGDDGLRLGSVKLLPTESSGELYPRQAELDDLVARVHRAGFQVAIHSVGPAAVEAVVTALEHLRREFPEPNRHRMEHCSDCPPELLERLARLRPVVVTQPPFLYYGIERYLAELPPDRLRWLYRVRSLLERGLVVAGSSDLPIASNNPLIGIYAAVTRTSESGQQLLPEECTTPEQALAMYTIHPAYASFEENNKGSITPGKLADVAVLSADPTTVPAEQIKDIRVEMTILGGEVVWES